MPGLDPLRVNRLLSKLSAEPYARIAAAVEMVDLADHVILSRGGRAMSHAYFPLTAVVSLLAIDASGSAIETASVGREGIVGLPGALAGVATSDDEIVVQVAGRLARIPLAVLRREIRLGGELADIVDRYAVALLAQVSRAVVCLRHHPVEARAARWLLACHDRVGRVDFVLTQDFLAIMLGQTRPQVSQAAGVLRRAGLITYRRGHITVLDRAALESAACDCYAAIRAQFDALLSLGEAVGG